MTDATRGRREDPWARIERSIHALVMMTLAQMLLWLVILGLLLSRP